MSALAAALFVLVGGVAPSAAATGPHFMDSVSGTVAAPGDALAFGFDGSALTGTYTVSTLTNASVFIESGGVPLSSGHANATDYLEPDPPAGSVRIDQSVRAPDGAVTGTVALSEPVAELTLHVVNLDASRLSVSGTSTTGDPITLVPIVKNNELEITGNTLNSTTASPINPGCETDAGANPNGGCGSIRLTAATGLIENFTLSNVSAGGGDGWGWTLSTAGVPALQTCTTEEVRATERYWYFGKQANINFGVSGNTATARLSPVSAGDVSEGSTVVTDTSGNLQFWSDGQTVYNRNSVPMPNGTGLLGAESAEQTVAAFPSSVPGQYFVVTTDAVGNVDPLGTLRYSIVDMTLNGGLGDVTTKNVQLGVANTSGEGLNAIPNADGTGFWVLSYTPFAPTMLAYEFDGDGPVTGVAVESPLSTVNRHSFGSINVSPDLTQIALLAAADTGGGDAHILDFDAETGVATETLGWFVGGIPYSMDFSPSGDHVYVSRVFPGSLLRYRIEGAASGAEVDATLQVIGSGYGPGGAVRRGPDGNMYVANRDATALGVVTNPDAAVPTFDANGLPLAEGSLSRYGLPQTVTGCAAAVDPAPARVAVVAESTNWTLGEQSGEVLATFSYGNRPLTPMMGDWNGDGLKTVGTFESGTFRLNNENDDSAADITFVFGNPRAYAVAGDYDGNGYDDVALYRYGVWEIHYLGPGAPADETFTLAAPFGQGAWPNTVPVAGDWDGDGIDGIGTYDYATGTWVLKNTVGAGGPDIGPFVFWGGGGTGSYPVVGDFGGIGRDTPGYRVGTTWTVRTEAVTGGATKSFDFGVAGSIPLTW